MRTCENDYNLATYEVTMTDVIGRVYVMPYCDRCTAGIADQVFSNNDASFAGPDGVIETLTFRLLKAEVYRTMAADPARRDWCNPCLPGEFICVLTTGRDGESYSVGERRDERPIRWCEVPVEDIVVTRTSLRKLGLIEIEMIADGRPNPEYRRAN